jgi:YD repeat-containing protein
MAKSGWVRATVALGGALLAGMAAASETKTYSYDALGRLTASTVAGGPSSGRQIGTCFDRAGNRLRYDVATSAPATCPTPTPTP